MTVARIGEVHAKEGLTEDLREFLISIMPTKFIMIEIWDSIESHQAPVKNIPPEKLVEVRPLLESSPNGGC